MTAPPNQSAPAQVTRIVIHAPHELDRAGLRAVLDGEPDLRVVRELTPETATDEALREASACVILVTVEPESGELSDALRSVARTTSIVALAPRWDEATAVRALRMGVRGLVGRGDRRQLLVEAIRSAAEGRGFLAPSVADHLMRAVLRRVPVTDSSFADRLARLTDRESAILRSLAGGKTTDEIARQLNISVNTVKSHVSHMLTKLRLRNRAQAVAFAYTSGLLALC